MKFFCEYCGARIDANIDDNCPNCGASYKKNPTFIKLEKDNFEEKDMVSNLKKEVYNRTMNGMKTSKVIFIFLIIVSVVITGIIISSFLEISNNRSSNKPSSSEPSIFSNEKEEKDKAVTVSINEFGETKKYKAKVTSYKNVEDKFNRLEDGYEYIKFDLVVENKTDNEQNREDVNCLVDGIAQKNDNSSGYSDLPFYISSKLAVKGSATFIVPKSATSYDIKYGDYITIHIEK